MILVLLGFIISSCIGQKKTKDGEKYSTAVFYKDDFSYENPEQEQIRTNRYLSPDTLYIFFETGFKSDTVNIKINNQETQTILLTDSYIGLAGATLYGDIKSIDKVEIKKNNGISLTINLTNKTMNLWTVNFYRDTLRAQRRKYLSWYE